MQVKIPAVVLVSLLSAGIANAQHVIPLQTSSCSGPSQSGITTLNDTWSNGSCKASRTLQMAGAPPALWTCIATSSGNCGTKTTVVIQGNQCIKNVATWCPCTAIEMDQACSKELVYCAGQNNVAGPFVLSTVITQCNGTLRQGAGEPALELALGASQDVIVKSVSDGPIRSFGKLVENNGEAIGNASAVSSLWQIENVSRNPIVAFVQRVSIHFPDGKVQERRQEYEEFFYSQTFDPGNKIDLSQNLVQWLADAQHRSNASIALEVTPLWIEFDDGTTLGEVQHARDLLARRDAVWQALMHLDGVYKQRGPIEFRRQLAERIGPATADSFIEDIREYQEKLGTDSAVERLQSMLRTAEERSARISSNH